MAAVPAAAQMPADGIFVISRERILREATAARRLHEAEAEITERLQRRIDETKAAFAAEEEELTRLRGRLPNAEFEARVADFDQRVRLARRSAQESAAALQKGFQDARAEIVAALPGLIERLRIESGARIILNADQVLAADPAIDLTDRAIALMDAEGPSPQLPEIELSGPLFELGTEGGSSPDAAPEPAR